MTMGCCHKEYAQDCEILVSVDAPASHNRTLYSRFRFGLLASSWLPSPLGIFLWSALHVMLLIVSGPAFWVLKLLTTFLCSVIVCSFGGITCFLEYVFWGLLAVGVYLVLLLVESIRFCLSFVGFLACHEWRRCDCFIVKCWMDFKADMRERWRVVPFGVPCMDGSFYKKTKDRQFQTWARWCEEVVHMHDAIVL